MLLRTSLLVSIILFAASVLSGEKPRVPDFTKGEPRNEKHDWNLGATGARGWVWAWHQHTTDARQILITAVAPGSPADGVLQKGDVLLGLEAPFSDDARLSLARALTEAEGEKGILRLQRWREGKTQAVEIRLPVLGRYAPTAPYDCAKSKAILEQGCAAIVKAGFKNKRDRITINIENDLKALALLATGRDEHRPLVAEYAAAFATHTPGGHISWGYGYDTLFLAEYVLATGDAAAMPALKRLAENIAQGQSGVGTWGHSFARPDDHILNGYGCMNQPGIVLTLAMAVAREAGAGSPQIDAAIARSAQFLRWYAGKGAIPYGDHAPWPHHEDNGKCSSAAVLFDLLGRKEEAAFFARMSLAAHAERESGHTGNFFNLLWALPGVSRNGVEATGAYLRESAWLYDFARGWDGRFIHQGIPDEVESYNNWDSTGAFMLAYALPLKKLIVTGRKPASIPALSTAQIKETLEDGRWHWWNGQQMYYTPLSTDALLTRLSSWSPAVRRRAAQALGERTDAPVERLVRMLDAPDRESRYGASMALRFQGARADSAAPKLRALLDSKEPWQRALAAEALAELSETQRQAAIPDLLKALLRRDDPEDPRRCVMGPLSEVLFRPSPGSRTPNSLLRKSLDGVTAAQRPQLLAAIRDVLKSEDGRIRGGVAGLYGKLEPAELGQLMPDILESIRKPAPSGEMFAYDIRMSGLELLARLRIREGMDLCVDILSEKRWGRDFARAARALGTYGTAAKSVLPRLKSDVQAVVRDGKDGKDEQEVLRKLIADIESGSPAKPVRSLDEYLKAPAHLN